MWIASRRDSAALQVVLTLGSPSDMKVEERTIGASIREFIPNARVGVVSTQWFCSAAPELTYKRAKGKIANELRMAFVGQGRPRSSNGHAAVFRRVSEVQRLLRRLPVEACADGLRPCARSSAPPDCCRLQVCAPAAAAALPSDRYEFSEAGVRRFFAPGKFHSDRCRPLVRRSNEMAAIGKCTPPAARPGHMANAQTTRESGSHGTL